MAFNFDDVLRAQAEQIDAQQAQAHADFEAARQAEDGSETMRHATRILRLDAERAALMQRANTYAMQQQHQQMNGNRFGLSQDELDVAHNQGGDMTKEQKEELYARNKQKLAYMRATGQYDDSQGKVFKR